MMSFHCPDNKLLDTVSEPGVPNGRLVTADSMVLILTHLKELVSAFELEYKQLLQLTMTNQNN